MVQCTCVCHVLSTKGIWVSGSRFDPHEADTAINTHWLLLNESDFQMSNVWRHTSQFDSGYTSMEITNFLKWNIHQLTRPTINVNCGRRSSHTLHLFFNICYLLQIKVEKFPVFCQLSDLILWFTGYMFDSVGLTFAPIVNS